MPSHTCRLAGICLLAFAGLLPAGESALKDKARELLARHQDALVTVKLVISMRMVVQGREMQKSEQTSEVSGTVLEASGLTVLAQSTSDPSSQFGDMSELVNDGEKMNFKVESDVSDLKIVLADGTEVPAQIVLKDKDLDLAFVKPKEPPAQPWPYLAFAAAPAPQVLDDTIILSRLGRAVSRTPAVSLGMIHALVRKPRTYYVTDLAQAITALGCPVFNAQGQTLGLLVMRSSPVKGGSGLNLLGGLQPVVLCAEDLREAAQQAQAVPVSPPAAK